MRKTKTFVSKGYSETSVPTIVYKDDCEPCAVYVNGERQDNISYIPKVNEGVSSVQYKSEYKNNLRTLQIKGNTKQDVSNVPNTYRVVECIESTGTQYIDTGILGKSSLRIVVKTNYAEGALLGTQSNTGANESIAIVGANGEYVRFMASNGIQVSTNYISKPPYEIDLSIANFKITSNDGQSYTYPMNGTSTTIDYPIYVFARNIDGQASGFSKRKVYSLKIYDNGTLVRDYTPCYRVSDGVIGLYDLVENKFYTNSGTGSFLKGADIALPSAYQQVEYIESTDAQFIDTGVVASVNTKIVSRVQMNYTQSTRDKGRSGMILAGSKAWVCFGDYGYGKLVSYFSTTGLVGAEIPFDTKWHTYHIENGLQKIDDVTATNVVTGTINGLSLYLLNVHIGWTGQTIVSSQRIAYAQIWDNGTLVRDYIPCYRKSDNAIGLYDLVNSVFYTNAGSGTFLKGKDVLTLPDEYQQVEYIESTGTQYIDTGLAPYLGLNTEINAVPIDAGYLFGSTNGQNTDYYGMIFLSSMSCQFYLGTGSYLPAGSWSRNTDYTVQIIGKKCYLNDGLLSDFTSSSNSFTFNTTKPIFLFGLNYGNTYNGSKMRIKSCKFYDGDGVVRNYIPCYRKNDGAIGLYDLANGVFYTNQGTGTFLKGANVSTQIGGTTKPTIANPVPITNCGNGQIEVVAKGVNEFDISKIKTTSGTNIAITSVGKNSITITAYTSQAPNGYCGSGVRLDVACPNIKVGKTYKLTFNNSGRASKLIYLNWHGETWYSGTTKTITEDMLGDNIVFYGHNFEAYPNVETPVSVVISDIMITEVQDAEYEPYFEPTTVSIPANILLGATDGDETLLELAKIGDFADAITIDRIHNEVKYIQRICRVRPFVGVGGTLWYDSYTSQYYNVDLWEFDLDKYTNTDVMKCEFAKVAPITEAETEFCVEIVSDSSMYIGFPKSLGITTTEALDNYLTQTQGWGLSIEYVLEYPIEWTITDNMGYTINLKKNLLDLAKNTKNQTNIIEITSDLNVSKTSVNYAKWGGSDEA